MAQTISQIAYGISLGYGTTSTGSFTPLGELLEITPPPVEVDEVKVYRSDNSTSTVEKIPGWTEVGDCEVMVTYQPSLKTTIEGFAGTFKYWKVTYPKVSGQASTGDSEVFYGFVKSVAPGAPIKDAMTLKIKLAVSGAVSFTAGS